MAAVVLRAGRRPAASLSDALDSACPVNPEDTQEPGEPGVDEFSLRISFAALACPDCGQFAASGPCPDCGAEVPATEELGEGTRVRRDVLLPIRGAAEGVFTEFEELRRGGIPITAAAMLSGFVEAALFSSALEVTHLGHELGQFDLDDPGAIGGPVLDLLRGRLGAVERALGACRELAAFAPERPGDELQEVAFELGRKAARSSSRSSRLLLPSTHRQRTTRMKRSRQSSEVTRTKRSCRLS